MSDYSGLSSLVAEIKEASNIELGDARTANCLEAIEKSVNELYPKAQRPGFAGDHDDVTTEPQGRSRAVHG